MEQVKKASIKSVIGSVRAFIKRAKEAGAAVALESGEKLVSLFLAYGYVTGWRLNESGAGGEAVLLGKFVVIDGETGEEFESDVLSLPVGVGGGRLVEKFRQSGNVRFALLLDAVEDGSIAGYHLQEREVWTMGEENILAGVRQMIDDGLIPKKPQPAPQLPLDGEKKEAGGEESEKVSEAEGAAAAPEAEKKKRK